MDVPDYLYQVAAPIGRSGIAVLGDLGHFVSLGKKRVTNLVDDGVVTVAFAFAPGETSRILRGYSPDPPTVLAISGQTGPTTYNPGTQQFTVVVRPGPTGTASFRVARSILRKKPPVQRRHVNLPVEKN